MYDRPTIDELVSAAILHFETQVIPAVKGDPRLYFQTLVAINVLKVAERELRLGWSHLVAEWEGMNMLEGQPRPLPDSPDALKEALAERQRELCAGIRAGDYDAASRETVLFEYLLSSVKMSLEVANPKFLQALAEEDKK
jgi:hypothetical protein